ncbi:MAG: YihY/virulence factor BrkB family protein [Nocardioidaceae bacterium]
MSWTERLDAYQRRHRWLGFPIAVIYKFADDQGNYLAALITYYAFLSLFPMLLLGSAILGFILQGDSHLQDQLINSALARFPVIGDQLRKPEGLRGSGAAVVVGAIVTVYGALGVAQAAQNALNISWGVPMNRRPNPLTVRVRSLALLAFSGLAIIVTTLLSGLGTGVAALGEGLGTGVRLLIALGTIVLNAAVFTVLFRLATAEKHPLRDAVPGALFVAIAYQLLQLVGTAYVSRIVKDSSATYGLFAIVLGMIAWIYLGAFVIVLGVEINVVRAKMLYPRALLTPFTDNVELTPADRAAYTRSAQAQRSKGFQSVDVTFDESERDRPDDPAIADGSSDQAEEPGRDAVS